MTRTASRGAVVLLVAGLGVVACSSGGGSRPPARSASGSTAGATVPVTRWWSNDAAAAGSTIDPTDPIADAGRLHPSRSEYCTMLSQTLKAGRSVLPGATAGDTALRTATAAFIGELQAVAPSGVAAPWRVVGQAVNTLAGGGRTSDINPSAVSAAAATIVTDAKDNCQLDLGPTKG